MPLLDSFCNNHKILVAGSTWPKDEEIVIETFKKLREKHTDLKLIIASHEVNKASTSRIESLIGNTTYSLYTNPTELKNVDILIVDTIGILSQLYRYGTAAYIGGGFNDGIHNISEALVYNIPVAFGTNHHKFVEAAETLQLGISNEINSSNELFLFFDEIISDKKHQEQLSKEVKNYMQNKAGATNKILIELNSI